MTPVWNQKDVPKPDACQVNGVSSNGRAVGWRRTGATGAYANYVADWRSSGGPAIWNASGLDGTTAGQALAVSVDGTIIFGMSPPMPMARRTSLVLIMSTLIPSSAMAWKIRLNVPATPPTTQFHQAPWPVFAER